MRKIEKLRKIEKNEEIAFFLKEKYEKIRFLIENRRFFHYFVFQH